MTEEQVQEFNPDKLRQALKARAYKQTEFANRLGVVKSMVNGVLTGSKKPSPSFFQQVCEILDFPPEFFFQPTKTPLQPDTPIFFRRYSTTSEISIKASEQKLEWLVELLSEILMHITIPTPKLPNPSSSFAPATDRTDEIEFLATQCRALWGLGDGPIIDLVRFMELNGILVAKTNLGFDKIDAFSCWVNNKFPVVLLGNDKSCCARSRFDAAHELGHLILHRYVKSQDVLDKTSYKKLENEADRFASAFLMPSSSFPNEVYFEHLEYFIQLKKRWQVSIAAMIRRSKDTGRISTTKYERLYQQISMNRWRKNEPLDDELTPESPMLICKAVEMAIESGCLTSQALQNVLKVKMSEIEDLLNLQAGFLQQRNINSKVVSINLKK